MTCTLPLDPTTKTTLKMQLYEHVANTPALREKIISGTLNCCIIKPQLICDPLQVAVAANKAVCSKKRTTKTVYTEVLFNLNPSKNISQSLLKFGIDDKDTSLLVVVLEKDGENVEEVFREVQGTVRDMGELSCLRNLADIRKTYKLSDVEVKSGCIVDSIVSRVAVKE